MGKRPLEYSHGREQQKKYRGSASTTNLNEERVLAICNRVKEFALLLCEQLRKLYAAAATSDNVDVFGKSNRSLPKRKYILGRSYASNPWMKGHGPPAPTTSSVADALTEYMRTKCADTIHRYAPCIFFFHTSALQLCHMHLFLCKRGLLYVCSTWIDHIEPRLLTVDGLTIRQQLIGDFQLGHELGNALLRRWAQIDKESYIECPYISFKHVLDLDFSVSYPR
jgi:hypothetical protein